MRPLFGDTFFFLALYNPTDHAHERAVAYLRSPETNVITTHWVLTELADALCDAANRAVCVRYVEAMQRNPRFLVVPCRPRWFNAGWQIYRDRPDKDWSLTDCVSFAVMEDRGIRDALTGDRHFEQAGYRALLR